MANSKGRRPAGNALLGTPAAPKVVEHDPLEGVTLPPFPDTPPELPEGEALGMPSGVPEGASEASPITEELAPSGGPAVDPETGETAKHVVLATGGKDPALQAELEAAEEALAAERAREDARVAAGGLHRPVEVPVGGPIQHVGEARLEDHKDKQAAYREHMRTLVNAPKGSVEELEAALAGEDADLEVESRAERADRERAEAKAAYLAKVEAMLPTEPRYVATGRAPRPKVCGHTLEPGDVVPGAAYFARLESWVGGGIIKAV